MNENDIIDAEEIEVLPSADDGRHLSWLRVFLVVVVALAAIGGAWYFVRQHEVTAGADAPASWFAPYVDVTATPQYSFENVPATSPTSAILAFVVSAAGSPCEPSWGAAYSLPQASDSLDLDRRVARLRQLGGAVTVSFGGAANSELSIGCTDPAQLAAAYASVVDRYSVSAIDLDVEGSASSASDVDVRRALAIAAVTTQEAAAGHPLNVWLTLPVDTSGLTSEGQGVLTSMLAAKVPLAGVNGMTMDYGVPIPAGQNMADMGESALTALQQQLKVASAAAGTTLSDQQSWQMIGATPMIGQNDIPDEVFGLTDASQLLQFAQLHQLGRLSMWSANRDKSCGPNYPNVRVVSDACSGIDQLAAQFGTIFGDFGSGQAAGPATSAPPSGVVSGVVSASGSASAQGSASASPTGSVVDDPATSPYAIWNVNQPYPKGTKVVWHRSVYQAKWYTLGDQPDIPVATADQSPWTLIGPVLPGDHPAPTP
ncbi:MAG TPA: chitinase, partial [Nakamurella sp.]